MILETGSLLRVEKVEKVGGVSGEMCCRVKDTRKVEQNFFSNLFVTNSTNQSVRSLGGFIDGSSLADILCNTSS